MKVDTPELLRLAAGCGGAAVLLTLYVAWHGTPIPGDLKVIREFQGMDLLRRNESWINPLGTLGWQSAIVITALVVAGFGPRVGIPQESAARRNWAAWVLLAALVFRFLTVPLKKMAQADRPSANFDIRIAEDFAGYGFPSGHVYSDVLIFGALAMVAPALFGRALGAAVRVFSLAVILLSGPSRMVVGAHWPSDVVGGFLWGSAALCLALVAGRRLSGSHA